MTKHYIIPIFVPHAGCPHLCVFCNQKRISGHVCVPTPAQVAETIDAYLATMPVTGGYREVAFYGGSFTAIAIDIQRQLLLPAAKAKAQGRIHGIRLSTRPDAVSFPTIKLLQELTVDTVELGIQSMVSEVLLASKRGHTQADVERATGLLKAAGLQVGHQLMPGLPKDTPAKALLTGQRIAALKPDFVRIYPTLVISNTELEDQWQTGLFEPWSLEQAVDVSARLVLLFESRAIKVIRVGLQPSDELRQEGTVVAGPFHSAFGELVENRIARWQLEALLQPELERIAHKSLEAYVHPKSLSKFIGQKKANRLYVQKQYKLADFSIMADASLAEGTCYWKFTQSPSKEGENRRSELLQFALPSY